MYSAYVCVWVAMQAAVALVLHICVLQTLHTVWLFCWSLSSYLPVCLCICLSVHQSVCASVCLCICLSICASVCLSVHLFVCLYICLPGCASVYLRMCMSVCACVCPDVTKVLVYLAQACHELVPPELVLPCVRAITDNFITERNSSEVMAVGWVECVVGILQHNLTWVVVVVVVVDVIVVFLLFSAMEMELQIQWRHPFV